VGDVLREQCGEDFFQLVERARRAAIAGADDDLHALIRDLPVADAETLIRAFATYFEVINLAERIHRIRRRRDYLRDDAAPQEGSLKAAGVLLRQPLLIEPVFTAHPTEATRRTLLEKEQVIGRLLVERLDPSRTPDEERAALARIREEVTAAWQTDPHPSARPTVMDELENILFYLTDVVYRIVPPFYEELEQAAGMQVQSVLRFGSWVGGDMDGNPNVGADTLLAALERQRELVLERYRRETAELSRRLSQSGTGVGVSEDVRDRVAAYSGQFARAFGAIPARYYDMPYRVLLALMAARLDATRRNEAHGYGGASELEQDLQMIIASLRSHRGEHAGLFGVQRLLRRVETFGFHLATICVSTRRCIAPFSPRWRTAGRRTLRRRARWTCSRRSARPARVSEIARSGCTSSVWPKAPMMCSPCSRSRAARDWWRRGITFRWTSRRYLKPSTISSAPPASSSSS
jgi:phosphoenolpyruvate carboxylase